MKKIMAYGFFFFCIMSCNTHARSVEDFNFDWLFHLGDLEGAYHHKYNDRKWKPVRLPHDWAVALPYTKEDAAASTGFKSGGIGWYRKSFILSEADQDKTIWLEFDGIYNNAEIWINGRFAVERPFGYTSFSVPINAFMQAGKNTVSVRVDRTAYADTRWYTGSGIYRHVRLVKANATHIPQWGIQVKTPEVSDASATLKITTQVLSPFKKKSKLALEISIFDAQGNVVGTKRQKIPKPDGVTRDGLTINETMVVKSPELWHLDSPSLYSAKVSIVEKKKILDSQTVTFGIRSIQFDANKGFFLNGQSVKMKGVNLHHDGGAVGAAVPKAIWRYRLEKLASVGVNAIRLSHNPHSSELLDLCDELGFLAISEAFDDWERPKDKSIVFLSDNVGKGEAVSSYSKLFRQWHERDLKDLIRRDINHPSIILWSIGNEVEWTYPYYREALTYKKRDEFGKKIEPVYKNAPIWEPAKVLESFNHHREMAEGSLEQVDSLAQTAKTLAEYVKQIDQSRPVTAGLVLPSVGFVSGYTDALDVVGFNYRAVEYDLAHKTYPDRVILGTENWGSWPEWKAVRDREFVSGIFIWTGFAYKGEAGPWPRKGLEISLFDFAGNKTPRGHHVETFWQDTPKVYLATIPAKQSEYQFDKKNGWVFTERQYPIKQMQWLRPWEWYGVEDRWNYNDKENVVVHVYSNTYESELFINGRSLGRQGISDDDNRILLWQLPFESGELKVVGYNKQGKPLTSYTLSTHGEVDAIELNASKSTLVADHYDVAYVHVTLRDKFGHVVLTPDEKVTFSIEGPATIIAVDNGWENSVQQEYARAIESHNGRAQAIIQTTDQVGAIRLTARLGNGKTKTIMLESN